MKRSICVFTVVLLALTLLISTLGNATVKKTIPDKALPVNLGVVYLLIVGLSVGSFIAYKVRSAKAAFI